MDQLLARTDATGDTSWYLTDRLGSVRKVANAAGEVTGSLDYDPFGQPRTRTGDVDRFGRQQQSSRRNPCPSRGLRPWLLTFGPFGAREIV